MKIKPITVDGRRWRTYACSYDTPDGCYTFTIMAISIEHAGAMLSDLKETARLDGELTDIIPMGGKDG